MAAPLAAVFTRSTDVDHDLRVRVADVVIDLGEVRHDVRGLAAAGDHVVDPGLIRHVFAQVVVGDVQSISTPSRAERPIHGAPEAWADWPWKRNLPLILAIDVPWRAEFILPGRQCRVTSTSSNRPSRTM